jgi:hypothetical protein
LFFSGVKKIAKKVNFKGCFLLNFYQNERTIMAWIRIGFLNKVHSDLDPDSHPQTWPQVYPDLRKTGMQNFAFLLFTV